MNCDLQYRDNKNVLNNHYPEAEHFPQHIGDLQVHIAKAIGYFFDKEIR